MRERGSRLSKVRRKPSPLVPAGAHKNPVRPFGGTKVHWTFVCFRLTSREGRGIGESLHFYRIFNVASPISTRISEMIQKRTITRGSGQPFSSKW
mgnify:CR=1 FL=1